MTTQYELEILIRTKNTGDDPAEPAKRGESAWTSLNQAYQLTRSILSDVQRIAEGAYKAVGEGADIELAASRFDNLAMSIGSTSDVMLNEMKSATLGMVSNADLVTSASQLIELGLTKTGDETVRLSRLVGGLGLDMSQLTLTLANQSTKRLDSLGLSVEGVTDRWQELKAAGVGAEEAFKTAVVEGLEARLELLGDTSETSAGKLMQVEAAIANIENTAKSAAAAIAADLIESLNLVEKSQNQANLMTASADYNKVAKEVREYGFSIREVNRDLADINPRFDLFRTEAEKVQEALMTQQGTDRLSVALGLLESGFAGTSEELGNLVISTLDAADADRHLRNSFQEEAKEIERTEEQLEALNTIQNRYAVDAQEAAQRAGLLTAGLKFQQIGIDRASAATQQHIRFLNRQAAAYDKSREAEAAMSVETARFFDRLGTDKDLLSEYEDILGGTEQVTFKVAGRTAEQEEAYKDLQNELERQIETLHSYEFGVKSVGLSQEEQAEKIADTQERIAGLQAALDPLEGIQSEYNTIIRESEGNQELLNQKIFDAIAGHSDNAVATALAGEALGIFTEKQAETRLEAALLDEFIRRQVENWDGTREGALEARSAIQEYIGVLNSTPQLIETEVRTNFTNTGSPGVPGGSAGLTEFQHGGDVHGGQVVSAAEAGAELFRGRSGRTLFIPPEDGHIFSNSDTQRMMGNRIEGDVNVNINGAAMPADPQLFGRQAAAAVSQAFERR